MIRKPCEDPNIVGPIPPTTHQLLDAHGRSADLRREVLTDVENSHPGVMRNNVRIIARSGREIRGKLAGYMNVSFGVKTYLG